MPIQTYYSGDPINGTSGDDVLLGLEATTGTPNNTINGFDGDDLILGDSTNFYLEFSSNVSIATAANIDTSSVWSTDENPFIGDTSVPYTSIYANAGVGSADYYSVSIGAGESITVDIDFGSNSPIGDSDDMLVEILDSMGNVLASNDDSSTSVGGLGSTSGVDSYLSYAAVAGGTYYIRVRPWDSATFPAAASYVMNVSVSGHVATGGVTHGNDILDGGAGDDTIAGQGGNDTLNGGIGNDTLIGGSGVDTLHGGDGNDILYGAGAAEDYYSDDDIVHGDDGNDVLYSNGDGHYYGDAGNDYIYAGLTGTIEYLDGGDGIDTVDTRSYNGDYVINLLTGVVGFGYETMLNFENVITGSGNDRINGTNGANTIQTNAGNDVIIAGGGNDIIYAGDGNDWLNGGLGADMMDGGIGDDTYIVDNVGDSVADSGGALDVVRSVITYTLGTGIENLVLFGSGIINGTGNDGNNIIIGNNQANVLDGGLGADSMRGGQGDDTYVVDNLGDRAIETPSANGFDTVYSSVSFLLGTNVERLILTGPDAINGTGNGSNNLMYGNDANNTMGGRSGNDNLQGNGGNDRLFGELGNDQLLGGDGNDWLQGGAGQDQLTGGAGADYFVFADGEFGTTTANADRILDFNSAQNDRIRLDQSDANTIVGGDQAYVFIGTNAFHSVAGEVRYEQVSGNTFVYGDRNGDGAADWVIRLDGLHALNSGDFVL